MTPEDLFLLVAKRLEAGVGISPVAWVATEVVVAWIEDEGLHLKGLPFEAAVAGCKGPNVAARMRAEHLHLAPGRLMFVLLAPERFAVQVRDVEPVGGRTWN